MGVGMTLLPIFAGGLTFNLFRASAQIERQGGRAGSDHSDVGCSQKWVLDIPQQARKATLMTLTAPAANSIT
jgi:hypothetical protein